MSQIEPSNNTNRSSSIGDHSDLVVSLDFSPASLGSPRQIGAGVEILDRSVSIAMEVINSELGETDQTVVERTKVFIDQGVSPGGTVAADFETRIRALNAVDIEQTRESRMRTVLEAGLELLGSARGPGLNLLNVTARTGLVVALTTVLRQMVGFYVEKAIREGDSPEASQAWAVAAITMIGPATSLIGAIRDECAGTANLQTRLGRVCMASITMGALIAAHLTGASNSMLSTAINTTVYTFARDLCNAFFPLNDNAGAVNDRATGAATVAFGVVQYLLEQLAPLMPPSGPGRAAADLGWSLGADAIAGAVNAFGAVADDCVFILCRSWSLLSPSVGLGSVDIGSLEQRVLEVRTEARLPTAQQLGNAMFNNGASRTSAFMGLVLALGAGAAALSLTDLGENTQVQLLNICLGIMMMLIYYPFIWSCSQSTPEAQPAAQLQA
ncbi:hypothetical protein C1X64_03140 [Pseudomonas sp. GW456-E7]|nr:hypothetical protein C1X64_03140 [Pseudomonas sp. GW456-E7]